jgi:hypothetical protein
MKWVKTDDEVGKNFILCDYKTFWTQSKWFFLNYKETKRQIIMTEKQEVRVEMGSQIQWGVRNKEEYYAESDLFLVNAYFRESWE